MKFTKLFPTIALICFCAISAYSQTDWSKYDFTVHYDPKIYGGKKTILENKRIFISDFVISQNVLANGKQMGTTGFAKMSINMSPLDVKKYNELVNKLYAQCVSDFKEQGFEIVSDEEVANSEFVKEQDKKKSVYAWYTNDQPLQDADQFGSETMRFRPEKKYIVVNAASIIGNFPTRYSKAINAQIVNVNININFVSFDGSRRSGYKGGASIEASPYLVAQPIVSFLNERGGLSLQTTPVAANTNWVGEKGIEKMSTNTTIFGSVRGTYVMDINEPVYMAEISAITEGIIKGFTKTVKKELE